MLNLNIWIIGTISEKIANIYNKFLDSSLYKIPHIKKYADHVYHLYVIRCNKRDEIKDYLLKNIFKV